MRTIVTLICSLTLATLIIATGCSQRENPALPEVTDGGSIVQGAHQFDSLLYHPDQARKEHSGRWIAAYLPPGYKYDVVGPRYPVLYLLPGYDGVPSFYYRFGNENYYQLANIAVVADRLITSGEIKPLIIIMPDASIFYGGSFYADGKLEGPWEYMMAKDLTEYVDDFYLTLSSEFGRESRAISGHSSGGYGALRLAMKYPDMFNSVSAIDAPLALQGGGTFAGIQGFFEDYLAESNITDSASYYDTDTTGFANQPYKILLYSMAATFSPSAVPGTGKFRRLGIDLPFDYAGNIIDSVWSRWVDNDLYAWLDQQPYQDLLDDQNIYFETSDHDVNLFNQQTLLFQEKLRSLGIAYESAQFTGYEHYEARSRSFLYDRIEFILRFHDRYLKDRFGNF